MQRQPIITTPAVLGSSSRSITWRMALSGGEYSMGALRGRVFSMKMF